MSGYLKWGVGGFIAVLILGGVLFSFGPLAVDWGIDPQADEVSLLSGVIIPAVAAAGLGAVVGLWLAALRKRGKRLFANGFLVGSLVFFAATVSTRFVPEFWSSAVISLIHLPGAFVSDTLVHPLLSYVRGGDYLIVQAKEPLVTWIDITVSWFTWGLLGAFIGRLLIKDKKETPEPQQL